MVIYFSGTVKQEGSPGALSQTALPAERSFVMCNKNVWKVVGRVAAVLSVVIGAVYVVYFWNLDQKLTAHIHSLAHKLRGRRKIEIEIQ